MNKKIVVVDDDDGILDALDALLDTAGYTVEKSKDGIILENLKADTLPDLILLDVLLSGKDGREICRELKTDEVTKNVPIIMISAEPTASKGAKACGADAFISKPFEMEVLLGEIERFTGKK